MKINLIGIVCWLSSSVIFAQSQIHTIADIDTKEAIPFVSVETSTKVNYANEDGKIKIKEKGPYNFFHINYEKQVLDTLRADTIFLTRRLLLIEGITIEAERIITEVEQSSKSDIKSFGIIHPNLLIAHTKKYVSGDNEIQLLDAEGKLIDAVKLEFDFDKMVETCDKQFFLISKRYAYHISIENQSLGIRSKSSMKDYRINYAFCETDNPIGRVFKYSHVNNLISEFFIVHKHEQLKHLRQIADHELLQTLSKDKQAIIYGANVSSMEATNRFENARIRSAQKLSDYLSLVHYNNQYAQNHARVMGGKLYMFNYQLDSIHIYDEELKLLKEEQFKRKNPEILFTDYEQKKIYSLEKSGFNDYTLYQFNEDLTFTKILDIQSTQITHIAIQSDKVFYLMANPSQYSRHNRMFIENI